jgi:hypothetical protein
VAPIAAIYAKYNPLKQKLIGVMGVTYQGAIHQNSFGNGAPSKEIENLRFGSKNTRERATTIFFWR